jgi:hypothetical protein
MTALINYEGIIDIVSCNLPGSRQDHADRFIERRRALKFQACIKLFDQFFEYQLLMKFHFHTHSYTVVMNKKKNVYR